MLIPFVGYAYKLKSLQLDAQNCVNWFLALDQTGKNPQALFPRPGLKLFSNDSNNHEVRAMFSLNNELYSIVDHTLYLIDSNGDRVSKGTLNTSTGQARVIANEYQLFITDKSYGYTYQRIKNGTQEAGTFAPIIQTSSNISTPLFYGTGSDDMDSSGEYTGIILRNYKIMIDGVGSPNTFKWSNDNGLTWKATGVAITGADQTLEYGVIVKFDHTLTHHTSDYWLFDADGTSSFYPPAIAAYQDTFGIYPKPNSAIFYISETDDFSKVNSLDFTTKSFYPDNIVAVISRSELWVIGETSTEVWYLTGAVPFPFEPRTNFFINYGCAAAYSVLNLEKNVLIWLAKNKEGARKVIAIEGYDSIPLSDEPLEQELASYSKVDDAFAFSFDYKGHVFYYLTFPTMDKTWAFDFSLFREHGVKAWHQVTSRYANINPKSSDYREGRFRANCYAYCYGKHLVGDCISGKIFELTDDVYLDYDQPITCERTCQPVASDMDRVFCHQLQLDIEMGQGLESGDGEKPTWMLSVSKDGGRTWGNERWTVASKIGGYIKRAIWNRIGMSKKSLIFKIKTNDPVYRVVSGARAEITLGKW